MFDGFCSVEFVEGSKTSGLRTCICFGAVYKLGIADTDQLYVY